MSTLIDYRGKTPKKTSFGIPLITAKVVKGGRIEAPNEFIAVADYEPWMRRGIPEVGDVVVTTEAPLGEVAQLGVQRVALAQRLIAMRAKPGLLDNQFLKFLMQSQDVQEQLRSRASGTTVLGIKQSELRRVLLTLPPLPEQRAIAHILGTLDDKIELNRRMNETLEAMARALFKSWFVDFDPVRANGGHFHSTQLGEVPQGWALQPIRDIVEAVFDGPHATPPKAESGAVYLGIKNFTGTQLDFSDIRHIAEKDWHQWTRRVTPRGGDIVFTYEATLGFFALIPSWLRCCLGRRTALIRPKDSAKNRHYLFHYLIAPPFQGFLLARTHPGSTVDRILLTDFPDYPVLLPPLEMVQRFEKFAETIWTKIHANINQCTILAALRNTLLPKLISGELRVKDAERFVGAFG